MTSQLEQSHRQHALALSRRRRHRRRQQVLAPSCSLRHHLQILAPSRSHRHRHRCRQYTLAPSHIHQRSNRAKFQLWLPSCNSAGHQGMFAHSLNLQRFVDHYEFQQQHRHGHQLKQNRFAFVRALPEWRPQNQAREKECCPPNPWQCLQQQLRHTPHQFRPFARISFAGHP